MLKNSYRDCYYCHICNDFNVRNISIKNIKIKVSKNHQLISNIFYLLGSKSVRKKKLWKSVQPLEHRQKWLCYFQLVN